MTGTTNANGVLAPGRRLTAPVICVSKVFFRTRITDKGERPKRKETIFTGDPGTGKKELCSDGNTDHGCNKTPARRQHPVCISSAQSF